MMRKIILILAVAALWSCSLQNKPVVEMALEYPDILDIAYTPDSTKGGRGWFTDQGAWMGFTLPEKAKFTNGFCGPYDLDNRRWISQSLVEAGYVENGEIISPAAFEPDSMTYFPGQLYLSSHSSDVTIQQKLYFVNKNHALLTCNSNRSINWYFEGALWYTDSRTEVKGKSIVIYLPRGEVAAATFDTDAELMLMPSVYKASFTKECKSKAVVLSFFTNESELQKGLADAELLVSDYKEEDARHATKWNDYLTKILRTDLPENYDRVAVKAMVTLLSNCRSSKGDLLHDGILPSHAVGYFVGYWAWDTWKAAVAVARFEPEMAKDQIRSMFDFQDEQGMIADCVYSDKRENNYRDSKPPLAAWSVMEVFNQTKDTAFLAEMYPKLLKYYQWWYQYRDNDGNGICEFGSTDGTIEAAAWESGMDNAVRFDDAKMVKNSEGAWSFDQESIDLNAYLGYEYELLQQMAGLVGASFTETDHREVVRDFFFDKENGYFFDRRLKGDFVRIEGPEGWTPIWTGLASKEQVAEAMKIISDTNKFSTYIPFSTLAADHPKFLPGGYWRGPIWLDQVYFGISGIRKYGYKAEADKYTEQVFTRLKGLAEGAPIHENYDTHDGHVLKAPHFSWSSAHLLMLYWEMNK